MYIKHFVVQNKSQSYNNKIARTYLAPYKNTGLSCIETLLHTAVVVVKKPTTFFFWGPEDLAHVNPPRCFGSLLMTALADEVHETKQTA